MLKRDLAFLNDYAQFGFMNHIVAALAFYYAGANAQEMAASVREVIEPVSAEDARKMAVELNDGARVQCIALPRLYAELAASIEDLGALCESIRNRDENGIFKRYVRSSVGQAAAFFDHVLQHQSDNLGQLLNLPTLDEMRGKLPPVIFVAVEQHYQNFGHSLSDVARLYRETKAIDELKSGSPLPASWHDEFHIVLNVIDDGDGAQEVRGGLTQGYNKIKHRFTIIENIETLINALGSTERIPYDHKSLRPEEAHSHALNTLMVVRATCELAALLIFLHEHGVTV